VGIATVDKMTKSALCQEKSTFRNPFTIDDFGLENGNNMVRLSLVSGDTLGKGLLAQAFSSDLRAVVALSKFITRSSFFDRSFFKRADTLSLSLMSCMAKGSFLAKRSIIFNASE
jgi:hypothetical protein